MGNRALQLSALDNDDTDDDDDEDGGSGRM